MSKQYGVPRYRVQLVTCAEAPLLISNRLEASGDIVEMCKNIPEYQEGVEVFSVVYLTIKHQVIWFNIVTKGTVSQAPVWPREIVKNALLCNAAAIALVHNHPSGDPTPSTQDQKLTTAIKDCCALFEISVIDHVILGEGKHFSFLDSGMLFVSR